MRTIELLQTKLQRPRVPRHFVPRPRLFERLDDGSQGPLTLVCAGAGYGKTTLVSSWIESLAARNQSTVREPAAWISLDERDSDLGLFLRYFVAGLRAMFPDACRAISSLLQATRQPPFDLLCATLINDIVALPQDFILVLDDHQRITGPAVPELLGEFERHWPQPMHLVLISRHMPGMSLATWRAKGLLTEIRGRDLRFAPDEAAAYLQQALPTPLSMPGVELLEQRTEGWIAGLQLASLSLRDAEDPEGLLATLSGLDVEFADYLANDVLARQPAAILSFLLQSAVFETFSVALSEDVITIADPEWSAQRCIDWLERRNLFIASLDSQKEWYRYHQMFRSVLLERSKTELGSDGVSDLQRKAAAWFANHGLVEEALRYALAVGDHELAASFVAHGLRDVLNREDRPTLERWLRLFPDEFVQERADLLIVRGFSLGMAWQLGAVAKVVRRTTALVESQAGTVLTAVEPRTLRGCLAVQAAYEAYLRRGDASGTFDRSQEALARVPESWSYVRGVAMLFQGLAMQADGRGNAAVQLLVDSYESLGDRTSTYALRLLEALCFVDYRQAEDLERVMQTAQKLIEGAERAHLGLLQSWGRYFVGLVHYQRNELAAARQSFAALLESRYTCNVGALRDGVQRLALIHQIAGERDEACWMAQFLRQLDLDQMGRETDETSALRARLALMRGDLASAAGWADGFMSPVPDEAWPWQDPPHLIKARILLERGTAADVRSALEILDALYKRAERSYNIRLHIELLALRALAHDAEGKAGDARDALQAAVDLAQRGGFLRVFLDLGPRMQEALSRLAEEDIPRLPTVRRILAEFGDRPTGPGPGGHEVARPIQVSTAGPAASAIGNLQHLVEPLTSRELEVLSWLRGPFTLKEIARLLFISHTTIKRHTITIYGKLGVHKRSAAVARAEALGLIPPR